MPSSQNGNMPQDKVSHAKSDGESEGISSFQCRLLSELFTFYKVNQREPVERFLDEENRETIFCCSKLSNHLFSINSEHLSAKGYGVDGSASEYLKATLEEIRLFNKKGDYPIVPLHVAGDGYCLMHAISRCLVGRELFWHPLIHNVNQNMRNHQQQYESLLCRFYSAEDIDQFIRETCPDYQPEDGNQRGLTLVHIFVLAQVLHRPIILLDADMKANAEYTGLFLPILIDPMQCSDKDGVKNPPLLISWSSSARNHFVPLVGIEGEPCAIPYHILPRIWGPISEDNFKVCDYIDFNPDSSVVFGLGKKLNEARLKHYIAKMEVKFEEIHGISAKIVTSYYDEIALENKFMAVKSNELIEEVKKIVEERCLLKCITCGRLRSIEIPNESRIKDLLPGGLFYELYKNGNESILNCILHECVKEKFIYDEVQDRLFQNTMSYRCHLCGGDARVVKPDGTVKYQNGDQVARDGLESASKIYWDGEFYDSMPEIIDLSFPCGEKTHIDKIAWFYKESDPSRNSNAYVKAQEIIEKYGCDRFNSQELLSRITDVIIDKTNHLQSTVNENGSESSQSEPNASQLSTRLDSQRKENHEIKRKSGKKAKKDIQKQEKEAIVKPHAVSQPNVVREQGTTAQTTANGSNDCPLDNGITIRLICNGQRVNIDTTSKMTYEELQSKIEEHFSVKPKEQIIKVGFPRRTLQKPEHEGQSLGLTQGETVIVDRIKIMEVNEEE